MVNATQINMEKTICNDNDGDEDDSSESDYYDAVSSPNYEMQLVQSLFNAYVEGEEKHGTVKNIDVSEFWPFTFCKIILSRQGDDKADGDVAGWAWEGKDFVFRSGIAFSEADEMAKCVLQVARSKLVLKTSSPVPEVEPGEAKMAECEKEQESFQIDHGGIAEEADERQDCSKSSDIEVERSHPSRDDERRGSLRSRVYRDFNDAATSSPEKLEVQESATVLNRLPDSNVEVETVTLSSETTTSKDISRGKKRQCKRKIPSCKKSKMRENKPEARKDKKEDHVENNLIAAPPLTINSSLETAILFEMEPKLKAPSPIPEVKTASPRSKPKIPLPPSDVERGKEEGQQKQHDQEQVQVDLNTKENDKEQGNAKTELKNSRTLRKRKVRDSTDDPSATSSPPSLENIKHMEDPVDLNEIQDKDKAVNSTTHKNTMTKRGWGRPRKCKLNSGPSQKRKSSKACQAVAMEIVDECPNKEGHVGTAVEINPCSSENLTEGANQIEEQLSFPCPYCSETFIKPGGLIAHLPVHLEPNEVDQETSMNFQNQPECKSLSKVQELLTNELRPCFVSLQRCDDNGSRTLGATVQKSSKINEKCKVRDETEGKPPLSKSNGVRNNDVKASISQVKLRNGKRGFKCSTCKKIFSHKTNAIQHLGVHSGVRTYYPCHICSKTFGHYCSLTVHNRQHHSGYRPHGCGKCLKRFATISHLGKHSQSHLVEKLYKCSHCNTQFKCLKNLRRHMAQLMMGPEIV